MQFGIGQSVLRVEDHRLVRGEGRYTDDLEQPGMVRLQVVRSPHSHARIGSIRTDSASKAPGVLAVLTAEDLVADGLGIPGIDFFGIEGGSYSQRDGTEIFMPDNVLLAKDRVRHVGEAVALVVAETDGQARDAAALVAVDYDPLPAVVDAAAALEAGAVKVWDGPQGNLCADVDYGDPASVTEAFANAAHVVSIRAVNNRVIINPMETRGASASFDAASGIATVYATTQMPHRAKTMLSEEVLKVERDKIRVVCLDMGGGFGTRAAPIHECIFVAWCARRTGRPVKWICDRTEGFVSDPHGRDNVSRAELALDVGGRFLALRVDTIANLGAYPGGIGPMVPVVLGPRVQTGVYDIPLLHARIRAAYTNTVNVHAYRGAGQPEANYLIERLIEVAARQTGIDPVALRKLNHIPADAMPYRSAAGVVYDSGEYDENLRKAQALADWDGYSARKVKTAARGLLRGRGIANYIQVAAGVPFEWGGIEVRPDGVVKLLTGTHNHGQGHETAFAQMVVDQLGVPFDSVRLIMGDTDLVPRGEGTHASRSIIFAGPLIVQNSEAIVEKAKRIAALKFEVAEADIAFQDGRLTVVGTDLSLDLFEAAGLAGTLPDDDDRLYAEDDYTIPDATYPSGTHICEVEVDVETGAVRIDRFSAIDDVGRAVNPMILYGQSHGGIAQGIGQALLEDCRYEDGTGQLLSGSLMDYCLPRAADLPWIAVDIHEAPSPINVLGVKGAGESGSTGAPPAVINAILNALEEIGTTDLDMPATPERVWRAANASTATREGLGLNISDFATSHATPRRRSS